MPTAALVAETLSAWREAERALDRLPPGTRDYETARQLALELHDLYEDLTEHRADSPDWLASSRVTILHARELLGAFRPSH